MPIHSKVNKPNEMYLLDVEHCTAVRMKYTYSE